MLLAFAQAKNVIGSFVWSLAYLLLFVKHLLSPCYVLATWGGCQMRSPCPHGHFRRVHGPRGEAGSQLC